MSGAGADVEALARGVRAGQRRAIGRAITLVESEQPRDRAAQRALLDVLLPHTGAAMRVGISGTPGVGKSTFIEAMGLHYIGAGHRVAVLAVDPSSPVTHGSILGDKTRMEHLMREERAFIRPSPSGGMLGGVAQRTRDVMLVLEAAGHDVVFVETVGVGQSEAAVRDIVDTFLLLMQPGAGDELQGIKRGVLELADVVVVNKADGALLPKAREAKQKLDAVLHMFSRKAHEGRLPAVLCSALEGTGLDDVAMALAHHHDGLVGETLTARRGAQAERLMWAAVHHALRRRFMDNPAVRAKLPGMTTEVQHNAMSPRAAADTLLDAFEQRRTGASS